MLLILGPIFYLCAGCATNPITGEEELCNQPDNRRRGANAVFQRAGY
jgi:hypothetical protein